MGPFVDSNEVMRCEYISTIILSQMNVSDEESSGHVDYVIKKILDDLLEVIICITEVKQNQPRKGGHKSSTMSKRVK